MLACPACNEIVAIGNKRCSLHEFGDAMLGIVIDIAKLAEGPNRQTIMSLVGYDIAGLAEGVRRKADWRLKQQQTMHHPGTDKIGHPITECGMRGCKIFKKE